MTHDAYRNLMIPLIAKVAEPAHKHPDGKIRSYVWSATQSIIGIIRYDDVENVAVLHAEVMEELRDCIDSASDLFRLTPDQTLEAQKALRAVETAMTAAMRNKK